MNRFEAADLRGVWELTACQHNAFQPGPKPGSTTENFKYCFGDDGQAMLDLPPGIGTDGADAAVDYYIADGDLLALRNGFGGGQAFQILELTKNKLVLSSNGWTQTFRRIRRNCNGPAPIIRKRVIPLT